MCGGLSFINITQKTLKSSKKCVNAQDVLMPKTSYPEILAEG